jgi:hypothetical protein
MIIEERHCKRLYLVKPTVRSRREQTYIGSSLRLLYKAIHLHTAIHLPATKHQPVTCLRRRQTTRCCTFGLPRKRGRGSVAYPYTVALGYCLDRFALYESVYGNAKPYPRRCLVLRYNALSALRITLTRRHPSIQHGGVPPYNTDAYLLLSYVLTLLLSYALTVLLSSKLTINH